MNRLHSLHCDTGPDLQDLQITGPVANGRSYRQVWQHRDTRRSKNADGVEVEESRGLPVYVFWPSVEADSFCAVFRVFRAHNNLQRQGLQKYYKSASPSLNFEESLQEPSK